jgi:hypothetical protein
LQAGLEQSAQQTVCALSECHITSLSTTAMNWFRLWMKIEEKQLLRYRSCYSIFPCM